MTRVGSVMALCLATVILAGCTSKEERAELLFQEVSSANTIDGYRTYMEKFPDGKHFGEVQSRYQQLRWGLSIKVLSSREQNEIEAFGGFGGTWSPENPEQDRGIVLELALDFVPGNGAELNSADFTLGFEGEGQSFRTPCHGMTALMKDFWRINDPKEGLFGDVTVEPGQEDRLGSSSLLFVLPRTVTTGTLFFKDEEVASIAFEYEDPN